MQMSPFYSWMCVAGEGGGGGGGYFPYILLNEIGTKISQLAKQSHWKLSADSSIAYEHISPVNTFFQRKKNGGRRRKSSTAHGWLFSSTEQIFPLEMKSKHG